MEKMDINKIQNLKNQAISTIIEAKSEEELEQLLRKFVHANSFAEMGLDETKK